MLYQIHVYHKIYLKWFFYFYIPIKGIVPRSRRKFLILPFALGIQTFESRFVIWFRFVIHYLYLFFKTFDFDHILDLNLLSKTSNLYVWFRTLNAAKYRDKHSKFTSVFTQIPSLQIVLLVYKTVGIGQNTLTVIQSKAEVWYGV